MQTPGANKRGSIFVYIAICLLVSASSSLLYPVLSMFLSTELKFTPLQISLFFCMLPVATICIVQTVARLSDMGLQRPAIICIAAIFGVLSCFILHLRPSFLFLATVGLICLASYPVGFPQVFASAREYSIKYVNGSIMFTTFLRSLASLSWVIGPPLSYALALGLGFDYLFASAAAMFTITCLCSFFFLPNVLDKSTIDKSNHIKWWKNRSVIFLFIGIAFTFTAFNSYLVSMPLFVTQELKFDKNLPGFVMGLAAGLEIPFMFFAARIARAIGLKSICILGGLSLVCYLFLLGQASAPNHILYIQVFAAIFIAFVSTMGMVFFQELLPTIPGQATSLYINAGTAGNIAGGGLISLASFGSYTYIYNTGLVLAIIGSLLLFFVKKPGAESENTSDHSRIDEIKKQMVEQMAQEQASDHVSSQSTMPDNALTDVKQEDEEVQGANFKEESEAISTHNNTNKLERDRASSQINAHIPKARPKEVSAKKEN